MAFEKDSRFISGRLKSLKYAINGAAKLVRSEHSIMAQCSIALIAVVFGFIFDITATEWMFQVFAIGLVLAIEGLNTAVEKIADFVHPDFHLKIGFIKDIAAGAVFFAASSSLLIGLIIYTPYLLSFIEHHSN